MTSNTKKSVVKTKVKDNVDLRELLVLKINSLYGAECELLKVFSGFAKKVSDHDLRDIFMGRVNQGDGRVKGFLRIYDLLGVKAQKMQSATIRGMIADAEWTMKKIKNLAALDAGLIAAACLIESCEITGYETAISWAKLLEKDEIADLLEQFLKETRDVRDSLSDLAELKIDERALPEGFESGGDDNEDEEERDDDDDEEDEE